MIARFQCGPDREKSSLPSASGRQGNVEPSERLSFSWEAGPFPIPSFSASTEQWFSRRDAFSEFGTPSKPPHSLSVLRVNSSALMTVLDFERCRTKIGAPAPSRTENRRKSREFRDGIFSVSILCLLVRANEILGTT